MSMDNTLLGCKHEILKQFNKQEAHGPHRSPEEEFSNIFHIISLFCYYLPLNKGMVLHLNKIESPLPKEHLYQVWLKLAQWF